MPEDYLKTTPGTPMQWSAALRDRPCWRCRLHLRWPPWRKHWGCREVYPLAGFVPSAGG